MILHLYSSTARDNLHFITQWGSKCSSTKDGEKASMHPAKSWLPRACSEKPCFTCYSDLEENYKMNTVFPEQNKERISLLIPSSHLPFSSRVNFEYLCMKVQQSKLTFCINFHNLTEATSLSLFFIFFFKFHTPSHSRQMKLNFPDSTHFHTSVHAIPAIWNAFQHIFGKFLLIL